jgi:hypothetical protein
MPAANYNFYIEQGATFKAEMIFKDSNGDPVDQTGRTFRGQIRSRYNSLASVADFTITVENQITDKGKITILLTDADTAAIPVDDPQTTDSTKRPLTVYEYDIEAVNVDLTVDRILQGIASVSPEVTR